MTAVLFTCAGQRVDVVSAFARAGARTVAVDANPLAPAIYHADVHAILPRIDDRGYLPALQDLIATHDVRLVVPLTDLDQLLLAQRRDELGAVVLLPDAEVVRRTADKYLAHLFFEERGIPPRPAGSRTSCPTTSSSRCSSRRASASAPATSTGRPTGASSTSSSGP